METINTINAIGEPVTMSEVLSLATWHRERTSEELDAFVLHRLNRLPDDVTLE